MTIGFQGRLKREFQRMCFEFPDDKTSTEISYPFDDDIEVVVDEVVREEEVNIVELESEEEEMDVGGPEEEIVKMDFFDSGEEAYYYLGETLVEKGCYEITVAYL